MTTWTETKFPEMSPDHAWQAHRTRCLKLAIKARPAMTDVNMIIEDAEKISKYILTRSELELKNQKAEK